MAIVSNTEFFHKNNAQQKKAGIHHLFDDLIYSDQGLVRKPNPDMIEPLLKKYEAEGIKRYEIAIIGDMLDRDVAIGINTNIRTILFHQQINNNCNEYYEKYSADFYMNSYYQFWNIVEQLDRDAKYLNEKYESENIPETTNWKEYYTELPSQNCINVGIAYSSSTKEISTFIQRGLFLSSERIKYRVIDFNYPLCLQQPLDCIINFLKTEKENIIKGETVENIEIIQKYIEESKSENNECGTLLIEEFHTITDMGYRYTIHKLANELIQTEEVAKICEKYGKKVIRPNSALFEASKFKDISDLRENFNKQLSESGIKYPLIIKTDKSMTCNLKHAKYFIPDPSTLDIDFISEIFKNEEFWQEDWIIEELVEHQELSLYKVYAVGYDQTFIRLRNSLPKSFQNEFKYVFDKQDLIDVNLYEQPPPNEGFRSSKYDEFNDNELFVHEITCQLAKKFGRTLSGFDFVLSDKEGQEFALVDVNDSPSFKYCKPERLSTIYNMMIEALYSAHKSSCK